MAGKALTEASVLMCPHGGSVSARPAGRAAAGGSAIVCATDLFTISGCSFSTAAGPSPCLTVQWLAADLRVRTPGGATLSEGSVGLCLSGAGAPQGAVQVVSTQPGVATV